MSGSVARITCANAAAAPRYGPDASSQQTKISVDGVGRAAEKAPFFICARFFRRACYAREAAYDVDVYAP